MRLGLAADHAGFALKQVLAVFLQQLGHDTKDFGNTLLDPEDDYPDFARPLAESVADGGIDSGVLVCGSGIGACIVANKIRGVRAGVCHDLYSARLGVAHNDMNVLVLGGRIVAPELGCEIVREFLHSHLDSHPRHQRRLNKLHALERESASR